MNDDIWSVSTVLCIREVSSTGPTLSAELSHGRSFSRRKATIARQLYFHHIPKTGGTALTSLIEMHVPRELICPANSIDELRAFEPAELEHFVLFRGTFANELLRLLPDKPLSASLLRDPLERAISHYLMNERLSSKPIPPLPEAIYDPVFEPIFANYMARYLVFEFTEEVRQWSPPFDPPAYRADQARADYYPLETTTLREDSLSKLLSFDVVGVTTDVYECYERICQLMEWEGRVPQRFRNTGDATRALDHLLQLSEDDLKLLLQRNATDYLLFQVAKHQVRARTIPSLVP